MTGAETSSGIGAFAADCPPSEILAGALSEGTLAPELEAHVESCARCADRLARLDAEEDVLRELGALVGPRSSAAPPPSGSDAPEGYEILAPLHRGGQGVVWRARRLGDGQEVALKTLLDGDLATPAQKQRFQREIATVTRIDHPNVVHVYGSGTTRSGNLYLAMELVRGADIEEHMIRVRNEHGREAVAEALRLFGEIGSAVQFAHDEGVIHRDLKPGNVMVDEEGTARVLDFGLARPLRFDVTKLTHSGQFLGSLAWAAPEQVSTMGGEVGPRTDVHALGLLLYMMLTGSHAFVRQASMAETVSSILGEVPEPPSRKAPEMGIHPDLDAICRKALEKRPEDRYESVEALLQDCRAYLSSGHVRARHTTVSLRRVVRRHPIVVASLVLSFLLLGAFSITREVRAAEAELELFGSRVENGILMARTGKAAGAEELLWKAYRAEPRSVFTGASEVEESKRRVRWALRELYFLHPFLASTRSGIERMGRLALDPSGNAFAVYGLVSARIEIRSLPELELLRVHELTQGNVRRAAFSRDGKVLGVVTTEGQLLHFEAGDRPVAPAPEVPGAIVDLHPFATGWILANGENEIFVPESDGRWRKVFTAPDRVLRVIGDSATERIWISSGSTSFRTTNHFLEREGGAWVVRWSGGHGNQIEHAMRGERQLFISALGAHVREWTGTDLRPGATHAVDISQRPSACWLDDDVLMSAGPDNKLILWDANRGAQIDMLAGYTRSVQAIAFVPRTRLVLSFEAGGHLRVRRAGSADIPETVALPASVPIDTTHDVAVSPRGNELLFCGGKGIAFTVDPRTGDVERQTRAGNETLAAATYGPGGRVYLAAYDGRVFAWGDDAEPQVLYEHGVQANYLAAAAGWLYSADSRGRVFGWNIARGELERCIETPGGYRISSLAVRDDGGLLAGGTTRGNVAWVEPESGRSWLTEGRHERPIRCVAMDPGGHWLASGGSDWKIGIWEPGGELRRMLQGHEVDVYALEVSPDGRLLYSADRGGIVRVWDTTDWRPLAAFPLDEDPLFALALDGDELWAGGEYGRIKRWDLGEHDRLIFAGEPSGR